MPNTNFHSEHCIKKLLHASYERISVKDDIPTKNFQLLSTYQEKTSLKYLKRINKKVKKDIKVECPQIVRNYNSYMDGVDTVHSYLGFGRIKMKIKK